MKKSLALLMLAAMLFTSAGCGNTMNGAKKDAQEAAQAVEQKVDEAKDKVDDAKKDAEAKVDEAKDAANQAADDAAAKVDEAKDAASQVADDAAAKVDEIADDLSDAFIGRTVALNGIMPGAAIEDVEAMFGEATDIEGNVMTFIDGLKVTLDDAKQKVKSISTTSADFDTPEGIYVGASEYSLNEYCGAADSIRQISGGAEYEYLSGDNKSKVVYTAQDGVITEITCSLK